MWLSSLIPHAHTMNYLELHCSGKRISQIILMLSTFPPQLYKTYAWKFLSHIFMKEKCSWLIVQTWITALNLISRCSLKCIYGYKHRCSESSLKISVSLNHFHHIHSFTTVETINTSVDGHGDSNISNPKVWECWTIGF